MEKAQKGDLIRITNAQTSRGNYKNGDIFEVAGTWGNGVIIDNNSQCDVINDVEYEIHRKAGEEESAATSDFIEIGCIFRAPNGSIRKVKELTGDFVIDEIGVKYNRMFCERVVDVITQSEYRAGQTQDAVNSPNHYTQGKFETIEIIEDAVIGADPFEAVCQANILKYTLRYRFKNGVEDLKKARWYLDRLIATKEGASLDE